MGADTAGQVRLAGGALRPQAFGGRAERWLPGLGREVGHPGEQIELAYGVTGHRLCVADRNVILEVLPAEPGLTQQPVPPAVDEVLRGGQIAGLAGLAVQLDQRGLDLRMAADTVHLTVPGAERRHDQIGEPAGDVEQLDLAGGPVDSDGGLDQVTRTVELVPPRQLHEPFPGEADLEVRIEVAVAGLDPTEQVDGRGES